MSISKLINLKKIGNLNAWVRKNILTLKKRLPLLITFLSDTSKRVQKP